MEDIVLNGCKTYAAEAKLRVVDSVRTRAGTPIGATVAVNPSSSEGHLHEATVTDNNGVH